MYLYGCENFIETSMHLHIVKSVAMLFNNSDLVIARPKVHNIAELGNLTGIPH